MADGTGLTGLVLRDASHLDVELGRLSALGHTLWRQGVRILTQTSGVGVFPPDRQVAGSVFLPEGRGSFDLIAVGSNVRLYRTAWGRAFLTHLNSLLAPGGELVLPVLSDERAERDGGWALAELAELFGADGTPVGEDFARFPRAASLPPVRSILAWFMENAAEFVHRHLVARYVRTANDVQRLDDVFLEFTLDSAERVVGQSRRLIAEKNLLADTSWFDGEQSATSPAIVYGQEYARSLRSVSYLVSGMNAKAAIVGHAIKTYRAREDGLKFLDFGGAYGFLGAELLLEPELGVAKAVTCDFDSVYIAGAAYLYRALRPDLHGRFFFSLNPAQRFEFDEQYSVVSFMSSLLYVPKEERLPLLERCWENLEPGGMLVVYEALRSTPPARDDAIQFTSATIDELLGRFGEVRRHSGTAIREVTVEEAAENSVFRVVVKRA